MAVKLDPSDTCVIVYCTDCGHWRAFAWTYLEGHDAAVRHAELVHPGDFAAHKRRSDYVRRHAVETGNAEVPEDDRVRGNPRQSRHPALA